MAQVRVRKRGKTFSYIFEAGKKPDGKRKVVEKGGFESKKAAYDAGVAAYNDWRHGNIGIVSENITLKDFITNWLEKVVAPNVKPTTLQTYYDFTQYQIVPYIGNLMLQKLTPANLDSWIRELLKAGFSKNTILHVKTFVRQALNYAVYPAELLSSNPANYIKVPKKAPTNVVQRHIISQEKLSELLEKYPFGTPYYIPILILYHTGMRIGELCGLTWGDVDFVEKSITICRQIIYLDSKGYFFTTPKTESSSRKILIDDFLAEELQRWKNQQIQNEKSLGDSYSYCYCSDDDKLLQQSKGLHLQKFKRMNLICLRENGRVVFSYSITNILTKAGLNAHSFRHTHATMLIENGATPKGVAERLGHSNIFITQNLYTHNTQKLREDTRSIFEKATQTNS